MQQVHQVQVTFSEFQIKYIASNKIKNLQEYNVAATIMLVQNTDSTQNKIIVFQRNVSELCTSYSNNVVICSC